MALRRASKILLVNWNSADWQLISPLLDAGQMPCLNRLVNRGTKGDLAGEFPLVSPLLRISLATGHRADRHQILGFTEPDPTTGRLRPVGSPSRKVKALWNILSQQDFRTHVIGWFASHPAEQINGVCVSDLFAKAPITPGVPWPMSPGTIHPDRLQETLAGFRLGMADLISDQLLPFVPRAAEIDQQRDPRLGLLATCLAKCATVHAAATWALEHEPWDFAAISYDLLDQLGHLFMPFHPPRREGISEADYEIYRDVMTAACRFLDMTLDRLLHLAGPEVTVLVVSDHGFHCGEGRPQGLQRESMDMASAWNRPYGLFCAAGPGILQDELIHGASILDVTPTILTLFGLPVGEDMPGRPLLASFEDPTPALPQKGSDPLKPGEGQTPFEAKSPTQPERIPSWENVIGTGGMWPPGYEEDPWETRMALDQLAALGYIEPPQSGEDQSLTESRLHQQFNLARVHIGAGCPAEAILPLEELHREFPAEAMYSLLLASCHIGCRQHDVARVLLDDVLQTQPNHQGVLLMYAEVCLSQNQPQAALSWLTRAESLAGRSETTMNWIGRAKLMLRRPAEAEAEFTDAIERNAQNPHAHLGLALARLDLDRPQEAAEAALAAVGLNHFLPRGHLALGIALAKMGRFEPAVQALRIGLSQDPNLPMAQAWLDAIDKKRAQRQRFEIPLFSSETRPEEPLA